MSTVINIRLLLGNCHMDLTGVILGLRHSVTPTMWVSIRDFDFWNYLRVVLPDVHQFCPTVDKTADVSLIMLNLTTLRRTVRNNIAIIKTGQSTYQRLQRREVIKFQYDEQSWK